ncbi:MAG: hypothetical protein UH241_10280 [Acutalibacteraceae bacterium]|nr:hypothetical protein [Acutalibacteraceae bacterium]
MSFIYLFLLSLGFAIVLSAVVGVIVFIIDVKRFSSYKAELDNLKQKYSDKLDELVKLQKEEVQQ